MKSKNIYIYVMLNILCSSLVHESRDILISWNHIQMGEDYAYWPCFMIVGKYMSIIFSNKEFKIYTIEIL